jgi:hypothetical protein
MLPSEYRRAIHHRKQRVWARGRRRYDAPKPPLDSVLACPEVSAAVAAQLRRQRASLDPFALGRAIEQQMERIHALANPRHSPAPAPRRVHKRLSINPQPVAGAPVSPAAVDLVSSDAAGSPSGSC